MSAPSPHEGPLPDLLGPGMAVLFVGFNPGLRTAVVRHHYAGRGNQFWRLLGAAGLTPRLLRPEEDGLAPSFGIGLTNLVERATASASELSLAELRAGVPRLRALLAEHRPRAIAYAGKGVYVGAGGRADVAWGRQPERLFDEAADYVLPSPSGLARLPFADKLRWYRELAEAEGMVRA